MTGSGIPVIRRRRRWPWVVAAVAVLGLAGTAWWQFGSSATPPTTTEAEANAPVRTVEVVRTDLVETTEFDGTLGRLAGDPIFVRRSGTVTAVREEGTVVSPGDPLIWIDGEPVMTLPGTLPAWRTLSRRVDDGADVLQLETALTGLGYNEDGDVTVDEDYTSYTEDMVETWQEDVGQTVDGVVQLGEVMFLSSPVRIADVLVVAGQPIRDGEAVYATSSEDIRVTFDLDSADQGRVEAGDSVGIELPDGTETTGTVIEVASVATLRSNGDAVFEVTVTLDDPTAAAGLDEAPVTVTVVTDRRDDVVAVPVTSLLALVEGGYAVEVVDPGGGSHLVAVEPGFFADDLVEVSGEVGPGDRVVVP